MNDRVRLLFVVPRFASINRGVETFVLELISRLNPQRFAITVLSGFHEELVPGVSFEQGALIEREKLAWLDQMPRLIRCLRLFGVGGASDIETFSLTWRYRRHWRKDAFDVVIPLGGTWSYRFARKSFPAARIVSIGQAGPVRSDLKFSDIFVGLTPHDESRATQLYSGISTCVIPNGVDTKRFSPKDAPMASHVDATGRTILCAAALVPDKRHDLLFDAVMRLPEHVTVRCVGSGTHRTVLEEHPLVRAGRVEFCQKTFAEMPDAYRGADLFSLASPDEAFGIVFIEAMACGLPVVANDGPRQRFVVGAEGVLCDVRDAGAYARALMSVLDVAPSEAVRTKAMLFDWGNITIKYEELFSRLAGRFQR